MTHLQENYNNMKQELSVWTLIENNEFEKACEKADEEYRNTGDILSLRNKVYALLNLKKYIESISLSEKLIESRKGDTESDFSFLGIANWMLGDTAKAIEAWQQGQNSLYKDAAGGMGIQVFLYFAAIKTGQDKLKSTAIKTIKKLLKSKRAVNFPGPLGHYLVDDITDNELLSYVDSVPILRERQLSQAHFVIAIKKLEADNIEGYYKELKDCISYGSRSYLSQMYYLAKGELEVSSLI
jgi:tetratricopeptide (TPR) repeat protein